jgi:hypothetical protein
MDHEKIKGLTLYGLDQWLQKAKDATSADIHTLCIEENGQHAGVDIHVGYSIPRKDINNRGYYETKIQVPRTGEVTVGKPT